MIPYEKIHLVNRVLEAAPLIPFVTAWVRRRHIPYEFKPVYYYVAAEAFLYFLDRISRITIHTNIYIYYLSTVFLVLLMTQAYDRVLANERIKQVVPFSVLIFYVITILDATYLNDLASNRVAINSYSHAFGCAILIILSLNHVAYLTSSSLPTPLEEQPTFFSSVAILIYCSSSIVTYVALNIVYSKYEENDTTQHNLDILFTVPDVVLFAVAMALLAWMFTFFPLSTPPRQALPKWLHYSRWQQRPFRLLHQPLTP